jgi:hypothetical protein
MRYTGLSVTKSEFLPFNSPVHFHKKIAGHMKIKKYKLNQLMTRKEIMEIATIFRTKFAVNIRSAARNSTSHSEIN